MTMRDKEEIRFLQRIDRDNNLGLIRYVLSYSIVVAHFNILNGINVIPTGLFNAYNAVGCFFAISGFLLGYRVMKGDRFADFCKSRAWRLMPSYIFVVLMFAVALGFVSTLELSDYFKSKGFWEYLGANLSMLNFLHPTLPGVFEGLELEAVNGSLWTLKIEWQLLFSLVLLWWLIKRYRLNVRAVFVVMILVSIAYRVVFNMMFFRTGDLAYLDINRQLLGQFVYFFMGVLLYTYYSYIRKHVWKISLFFLGLYCCFHFGIGWVDQKLVFTPILISLTVISIGLTPGNFMRYIDRGHNISYEIYLCHFPIIQLSVSFGLIERVGLYPAFFIVLGVTLLLAILTYSLVGRLYLRRNRP